MGRNRTRLDLSAPQKAELHRLLGPGADARVRERAQCALWAASGQHTLEDLAEMAGRARATIQNWLDKFNAGGVGALLERHTPPGSASPIASGTVQTQLRAGLRSGRWQSAAAVARWLQATHGIRRSRKSVYYWFGKLGRPLRPPNLQTGKKGGRRRRSPRA